MDDDHLYIVTYDIADPRRWRVVFRLMQGYGEWLQLSVFQCRLSRMRRIDMAAHLSNAIASAEDHVLIIDVGPAQRCTPHVQSIGKQAFVAVERKPIIV